MAAGVIEYAITDWDTDRPALQQIRRAVFIEEQGMAESDEWDDDDPVSVHVLVRLNREPVGTGRLNPAGKIGRIAVLLLFAKYAAEAHPRGKVGGVDAESGAQDLFRFAEPSDFPQLFGERIEETRLGISADLEAELLDLGIARGLRHGFVEL